MYQENSPQSPDLLKQETPERKIRVAQRDLSQLAESIATMTPAELQEVVNDPLKKADIHIKDPKTYENPAIKAELNKLRVKALAYQFEDGFTWADKKFKAIETDPTLHKDEQEKAHKIKNNLSILSLTKKEWEQMRTMAKDPEKLNRIQALIEAADKKIEEKKPESISLNQVDDRTLNTILDEFTLSQDKIKAQQSLKELIDNCAEKMKDNKLEVTMVRKIENIKKKAESYWLNI